jgi:hypothetical protein
MKIQYKNFKDQIYFVHTKPTKTGKIRYICSLKESDSNLSSMPDGMEFYENANGKVFLRKKLVSAIDRFEYITVESKCKQLASPNFVRFELSEKSITVFSAPRYEYISELPTKDILTKEFQAIKNMLFAGAESCDEFEANLSILNEKFNAALEYKAEENINRDSKRAYYLPALRFTLEDEKTREFSIERMHYYSDKEEWIYLESGKLVKLIDKYAPHIEKESLYEFF